jgi:hypothetical protein
LLYPGCLYYITLLLVLRYGGANPGDCIALWTRLTTECCFCISVKKRRWRPSLIAPQANPHGIRKSERDMPVAKRWLRLLRFSAFRNSECRKFYAVSANDEFRADSLHLVQTNHGANPDLLLRDRQSGLEQAISREDRLSDPHRPITEPLPSFRWTNTSGHNIGPQARVSSTNRVSSCASNSWTFSMTQGSVSSPDRSRKVW